MLTSVKISAKFRIERIIIRKKECGYTVARVKFIEYKSNYCPTSDFVIKGYFLRAVEEDEFIAEGSWEYDQFYGYQFVVESPQLCISADIRAMKRFLQRIGGVGKNTAEKLVREYGLQVIDVLKSKPETINIKGISSEIIERISQKLIFQKKFEQVAIYLMSHGLTRRACISIYEEYGDTTILKIHENPYCILRIKDVNFSTADSIAIRHGLKSNDPRRIEAAVVWYLESRVSEEGNMYERRVDILENLPLYLKKTDMGSEEIRVRDIENAISNLVTENKLKMEFNDSEEECIYLAFMNYVENAIVREIQRIQRSPKHSIATLSRIRTTMDYYAEDYNLHLAKEQRRAVERALTNGISILTGGPGTGKTHVVNAIMRIAKSCSISELSFELCAPTGKAAMRMSEFTGVPAKTIHRLVGIFDEKDERSERKVAADFLIVDEASMIDAFVFYRMLKAVQDGTRVIIVGDCEQLPSVGAGLVLRDIIESGKIATTKLTEIFRQAQDSQIVTNAHSILKGEFKLKKDPIRGDFFHLVRNEPKGVLDGIIASVKKLLEKGHSLNEIQVLSPKRNGDIGLDMLNKKMQDTFNPLIKGKKQVFVTPTMVLRMGDRVMQTRNNYDMEVYNGEVGTIIDIEDYGGGQFDIRVDFQNGAVSYTEDTVEELVLAYAITVHKSQGSEFPIVIMPVHQIQESILCKSIIYTGITRAKNIVILVGTNAALEQAVQKKSHMKRNSNIKEKLQNMKND